MMTFFVEIRFFLFCFRGVIRGSLSFTFHFLFSVFAPRLMSFLIIFLPPEAAWKVFNGNTPNDPFFRGIDSGITPDHIHVVLAARAKLFFSGN